MSTALLNLLFAQVIYKQFVDAETEARRNAENPVAALSRRPLPVPASQEFFKKLSQDLKNHPLNSDFNLSPGACESLYNALFPQNPSRPTTTIIQSLLAKLYDSYKSDIVALIHKDEQQFQLKQKEIKQIENGKLDAEILIEQEKKKPESSRQKVQHQPKQVVKELKEVKEQKPKTTEIKKEPDTTESIPKTAVVKSSTSQPVKIESDLPSIPKEDDTDSKLSSPIETDELSESDSSSDKEDTKEDSPEKRVTRSAAKAKQIIPKKNTKGSKDSKDSKPEDTADVESEAEPEPEPEAPKRRSERRSSQRLKKLKGEKDEDSKDEDSKKSKKEGESEEDEDEDGDKENHKDENKNENKNENGEEKKATDTTPAPSSRTRSSIHRKEEPTTRNLKKRKRQNSPPSRSSSVASNRRFFNLVTPLLSDISSNKSASFFSHPVNPNDAPNYFDLIYHPTDIRTIKAKVKDGRIQSTAELEKELQLMFANAVMYNGWDSDVSMWTREMQRNTETLLALFRGAERTAAANAAALNQNPNDGSQSDSGSSDGDTDEEDLVEVKKKKK